MKNNAVEMGMLRERHDGVPGGSGGLSLNEKILKILLENPEAVLRNLGNDDATASIARHVLVSSTPEDVAHITQVSSKKPAKKCFSYKMSIASPKLKKRYFSLIASA